MSRDKYIFLIEDLKNGNPYPYLIIGEDEERDVSNSITVFSDEFDIEKLQKEYFDNKVPEPIHTNSSSVEYPDTYVFDNSKMMYVESLDLVKKKKIKELAKDRDNAIEEDIEVHGKVFQVRNFDLQNFYDIKIATDLEPNRMTDKLIWRLADNTFAEFTYAQILEVLTARILRKQTIFEKFQQLETKANQATTIEEVYKVQW